MIFSAIVADDDYDLTFSNAEHRGKTSAHAQVLENIVGNLNPVS